MESDPLIRVDAKNNNDVEGSPPRRKWCSPHLCVASSLCLLALMVPILLLLLLPKLTASPDSPASCSNTCSVQLVESIPEDLVFNQTLGHMSTYEAWSKLLTLARKEIHLAGMYWSLRGQDVYSDPSDWQGEDIFKQLLAARQERGLELKIAQDSSNKDDTDEFARAGAEVRGVDFKALVGAGILHTKLWVVDGQHFYVGSANFDWRSLTQVRE